LKYKRISSNNKKNDRSVEKEKEVMHEKQENKPATGPS
jgi:hypothetical protein